MKWVGVVSSPTKFGPGRHERDLHRRLLFAEPNDERCFPRGSSMHQVPSRVGSMRGLLDSKTANPVTSFDCPFEKRAWTLTDVSTVGATRNLCRAQDLETGDRRSRGGVVGASLIDPGS